MPQYTINAINSQIIGIGMMKKVILIFGYGYVSKFLASELSKNNCSVYITSRNFDPETEPLCRNIKIINFFDSEVLKVLELADIVLSTVPTNDDIVDPVLHKYFNQISQKELSWIGYISSTSVYGNHDGAWVNEQTKCKPTNLKAKTRLLAEKEWLTLYSNYNLPVHIFRLSGIYGPERNCLEEIIKGKNFTVVKDDHNFSRIHVADICKTVMASIHSPNHGQIYNVSDDEPAPLHVVQQFGADILKKGMLQQIPFEKAELSQMAKDFFTDHKKINNDKIKNELNIELEYPNYRVGLLKGCLPYLIGQL